VKGRGFPAATECASRIFGQVVLRSNSAVVIHTADFVHTSSPLGNHKGVGDAPGSAHCRIVFCSNMALDQSVDDTVKELQGGVQEKGDSVDVTSLLSADPRGRGAELSAAALGRMLGLATTAELKLIEQKIDAVSGRIAAFGAKLDKIMATVSSLPGGQDLERIDLQIATMKAVLSQLHDSITRGEKKVGEE
jgi:hypothetical protein